MKRFTVFVLSFLVLAGCSGAEDGNQPLHDNPNAKTIDLLKLVDPATCSVHGRWSVVNGELVVEQTPTECFFRLPYHPGEDYDFHVVFNRTAGGDGLKLLLTSGLEQFGYVFGGAKNTTSGLSYINGKASGDNETKLSLHLENNAPHDAVIRVRKRFMRVIYDGVTILNFDAGTKGLSLGSNASIGDLRALGLWVANGAVKFQKIEVRDVSGTGKVVQTVNQLEAPDGSHMLAKDKTRNLMPFLDSRDSVEGLWRVDGGALKIYNSWYPRFRLPCHPGSAYDLRVVFRREAKEGNVGVVFPVAGSNLRLTLCGWKNAIAGVDRVDGRLADINGTKVESSVVNGTDYELKLQVRPDSVKATLNGKDVCDFNPEGHEISAEIKVHDVHALGLFTCNSSLATFSAIEITGISGDGYLYRPEFVEVPPGGNAATAERSPQPTEEIGTGNSTPFMDFAPPGGYLCRLQVEVSSFNNETTIRGVIPYYMTPNGEVRGKNCGFVGGQGHTISPKPGYAIGALVCKPGKYVQGIQAVFMKIDGQKLSTADAYNSEWFGIRESDQPECKIGGDGRFVVGIYGRKGSILDSIGLLLAPETKSFKPAASVAEAPVKKIPRPSDIELKSSEKLIQQLYKADIARAKGKERPVVAALFKQRAAVLADDPAAAYALLNLALSMMIEAGDLEQTLQLCDDIDAKFESDSPKLKQASLLKLSRVATDADTIKAAVAYRTLIDKPDDSAANKIAGNFEIAARKKVSAGMVLLVKCNIPAASAAAIKDVGNPQENAEQIAVADMWWDLLEKETDKTSQRGFAARASYWYALAEPAAAGLEKAKATKRIGAIKAKYP